MENILANHQSFPNEENDVDKIKLDQETLTAESKSPCCWHGFCFCPARKNAARLGWSESWERMRWRVCGSANLPGAALEMNALGFLQVGWIFLPVRTTVMVPLGACADTGLLWRSPWVQGNVYIPSNIFLNDAPPRPNFQDVPCSRHAGAVGNLTCGLGAMPRSPSCVHIPFSRSREAADSVSHRRLAVPVLQFFFLFPTSNFATSCPVVILTYYHFTSPRQGGVSLLRTKHAHRAGVLALAAASWKQSKRTFLHSLQFCFSSSSWLFIFVPESLAGIRVAVLSNWS